MNVTAKNHDKQSQAIVTIYSTLTGAPDEVFIQPGSEVDLPANHRVHQNSFIKYPKLVENTNPGTPEEVTSSKSKPTPSVSALSNK